MELRVAFLPGDGVGPEVTESARRALGALAGRYGFTVWGSSHPIGWTAVQEGLSALPDKTLHACIEADAVFLGAVGHPATDGVLPAERPETALLELRAELGCWANLRPLAVWEELVELSALRPERVRGTDLLVVRELGGGLYYGEPRGSSAEEAWNTLRYAAHEVRRIAEMALDLAEQRRGRVTSVDKANVLEASRLWRDTVTGTALARPHVTLEHMFVDRAAMELVLNPTRFDVILTSNLFGDILSDEAGALAGSLGVLGSASLGGRTDLYEPVHGSAPDLAGRGVANPIGAFASVSLMLRHTFALNEAADTLDAAVRATLAAGIRTADLGATPTGAVGTDEFTDAVCARIGEGVPT